MTEEQRTQKTKKKRIGVWIDHRKAHLVTTTAEGAEIRTVLGDVEAKHKSTGGTRSARPYWHRSVESAKRHELHREGQIRRFFSTVATELRGAAEVLVIGPKVPKQDFVAFLKEGKHGRFASLEAGPTLTSRITKPQIVAFVRDAFGTRAPRKTRTAAGVPVAVTR